MGFGRFRYFTAYIWHLEHALASLRTRNMTGVENWNLRMKELSSLQLVELQLAYSRFTALVQTAGGLLKTGDICAAAKVAQAAASLAFPGHVGLFTSVSLEQVLLNIGLRMTAASLARRPYSAHQRLRVMHVLTYGREVGGDSRFVWRWIQEDTANEHSVVITSQSESKRFKSPPKVLKAAAETSGGKMTMLTAPKSMPLEQARELRELSSGMDVIALHHFPDDIVPVIAFADETTSPKIVFINHSDHTFWTGGSVANLIANLRSQPSEFYRARRGLRPEQSTILPIPIPVPSFGTDKEQIKQTLNYPRDAILFLTIASPFKYESEHLQTFLELVVPVLEKHPNAYLLAVGPELAGAWSQASSRVDGRLKALGTRWDTDKLFAAADVYLDSIPFSSITSLLEAGMTGLPLVGYQHPEFVLLGPGAPGLTKSVYLAANAASYRQELDRLILCREYRETRGRLAQQQIETHHMSPGWMKYLSVLYQRLEETSARVFTGECEQIQRAEPLDQALWELYGGCQTDHKLRQILAQNLSTLTVHRKLNIVKYVYDQHHFMELIRLFCMEWAIALRPRWTFLKSIFSASS